MPAAWSGACRAWCGGAEAVGLDHGVEDREGAAVEAGEAGDVMVGGGVAAGPQQRQEHAEVGGVDDGVGRAGEPQGGEGVGQRGGQPVRSDEGPDAGRPGGRVAVAAGDGGADQPVRGDEHRARPGRCGHADRPGDHPGRLAGVDAQAGQGRAALAGVAAGVEGDLGGAVRRTGPAGVDDRDREGEPLDDHLVVDVGRAFALDPHVAAGHRPGDARRGRGGAGQRGAGRADAGGPAAQVEAGDGTAEGGRAAQQGGGADASGDEGVEVGDHLEAFARLGVECRQPADEFLHVRSVALLRQL
ncbi:hypothetical protein KZZ52_18870 [Dactylosporangium sp. AC04546]|uniref:hypothetical protein n=1 Tax=Dactylosporangium sp. AC04546 TaxID=2862460 RepID=UPI001EDD09D4|nr:hypothetical protein [Dactylosporangium sp. AC04546]WVK87366.1 hypothetical protein KZZ52_18870 [Dactylosporangium sp. AC04546]